MEEIVLIIFEIDTRDARDRTGANVHAELVHGCDIEIKLPGLLWIYVLVFRKDNLLKRLSLSQFVQSHEELPIGSPHERFHTLFVVLLFQQPEARVLFEQIEQ